MVEQKSKNQITADKLSRYICTSAYISMYPALVIFIESWLGIRLDPIFYLNSNIVSNIFFFLSLMFPAIVWLLFAKIFKKINLVVTMIFFVPFVGWQFIVLFFGTLFMSVICTD